MELNRIEDMPGSNFIPPCESKDNAEQNNNDGEIISSQTHDATQDSTIEMIQKQAQQKHDSMNTNNEDTSAYQSSSDVEVVYCSCY